MEVSEASLANAENISACLFPPCRTSAPRPQKCENEAGLLNGMPKTKYFASIVVLLILLSTARIAKYFAYF